ncbi:hypothetical protein RV02_GL001972 [Enterococcus gilvus]|nr:hypothetical protein RV02_GL001972 [Enterococcus gilvus]
MGKVLFVGYLIVLIWILLFKFSLSFSEVVAQFNNQSRSINLIPFKGSVVLNQGIDFSEMINNLLIFIPFGGLLGIIDKNSSFAKKIMYIFLFSLSIEALQFVFGLGATDITDIITNTLGGTVGLLIYSFLKLLFKENKLDRILTVVGMIIFTCCLVFLIFLVIVN